MSLSLISIYAVLDHLLWLLINVHYSAKQKNTFPFCFLLFAFCAVFVVVFGFLLKISILYIYIYLNMWFREQILMRNVMTRREETSILT